MDLLISGRSAIVCGSSRGLGKASAKALALEGVNIYLAARTADSLNATAAEISAQTDVEVHTVVADVTTEQGRDSLLNACPSPDILINNAGGPAPGDFRDWRQADWFEAVNANMFSAIDMIRRTLDGMVERRFGRIVNITSMSVKLPQKELGLSNGARAGLTGFVSGIAREPAQHNVTINNLLPGMINTDRMANIIEQQAKKNNVAVSKIKETLYTAIPAKRPGDPDEFGSACAFLCSQQAAYFTAQNFLMDGGLYPGTL